MKEKNIQETVDLTAFIVEADGRSRIETDYLKEVLTKYYRLPLPFDIEEYRHFEDQPFDVRIAIQNDPFWNKIGKFIQVMDFSEEERGKFARDTEYEKIALFLLFERNLEVLEAVFNNPRLPTKILLDYIQIIKERDIDREDDKILRLAQKICRRRSRRIVKAKEVHAIIESPINEDRVINLMLYLVDEDPQIAMAASNALSAVSTVWLKRILDEPLIISKIRTRRNNVTGIEVFSMFQKALRIVLHSIESSHMIGAADRTDPTGASIGLRLSLRDRKLKQLQDCTEDPVDLFNMTSLIYLQSDNDKEIQGRAARILQLDDVFDLLLEETTPRYIVDQVLQLLETHPLADVQNRAKAVRIKETERLNKKMKEIEVSVNAYFDVIFSSLGYRHINDQKDAVKILRSALTHLQIYVSRSKPANIESSSDIEKFINQAIEHYEGQINAIYGNTKKEMFVEMEEIRSMIRHILDLKNFKFETSKEGETPSEDMLNKAVLIWRNTISQYLGRVKDLESMLHVKWSKLNQEKQGAKMMEGLEDELHEGFGDIEKTHKENVECKLRIPCHECKRRGCATERFLYQVDFLLEEINNTVTSKTHA